MKDVYQEVTDRMIEEMKKGIVPWRKPWSDGVEMSISHVTGRPYSLLNQLLLGWKPGEWLTFRQCAEEGGHVKKGEKSHIIVFWSFVDKKDGKVTVTADGDTIREQVPILRWYNVFHIDQCEGITPRFAKAANETPLHPDARADAMISDYVKRSGVTFIVRHSDRAFYRPADDLVVVPELSQYDDAAEFYSTALHELTHSTGHPSRLNRIDSTVFASEAYSAEELVAELGSSFLMSHAGLETPASFANSAAYLRGWLKALRDDKRLLVKAAGKAERAVQLILGEGEKVE